LLKEKGAERGEAARLRNTNRWRELEGRRRLKADKWNKEPSGENEARGFGESRDNRPVSTD